MLPVLPPAALVQQRGRSALRRSDGPNPKSALEHYDVILEQRAFTTSRQVRVEDMFRNQQLLVVDASAYLVARERTTEFDRHVICCIAH
jgi:hypothetical protein